MVEPSFWKGKRVFLTGHTGFKGSWLTVWLHEMGAEVYGFGLQPETSPSLFRCVRAGELCRSRIADLREREQVAESIQECDPQIVMHLAAQSLVLRSYDDPVETYSTNVLGTLNLLQCCRELKSLRVVVNVTTDKVYDNVEWCWPYRECDRLGGHDPYSSSKACSEIVTDSFRKSFFEPEGRVRLITCRAGNVIGGGDWSANRLVPDAMRALASGKRIMIRNPRAVRPWQHVLEPLGAYLLVAQKGWDNSLQFNSWNFGPDENDEIAVGELADRICRCWGSGAEWHHPSTDASAPHEAGLLRLECSQARQALNWRPRTNLESAIKLTVDWYKTYYENSVSEDNILSATIEQIRLWQRSCVEVNSVNARPSAVSFP